MTTVNAIARDGVIVATAPSALTSRRARLVDRVRLLQDGREKDLTSADELSSKTAMNGTATDRRRSKTVALMFRRVLLGGFAICVSAIVLASAVVAVAAEPEVMPRVRSSHAYIRAMIEEAAERSDTFRRLVKAIEATDGLVYVEQGVCGHSVRACLALHVTPAAGYRILRVVIDARQPDWDVMSSIGHELQHALEVLGNRTLTTQEAIYLFYAREGLMMESSFETPAAVKTGNAVRNEVSSYARRRQS